MPKVLIADALSPRAVEIFRGARHRGRCRDRARRRPSCARRIAGYDGLAVRSATKVTAELLAAADALKVVGRAGIGVDNIDVPAATERGIVVMNTPYGNAITAAEHTIAMMFALARQIPAADRSTQAGKWEKSRFMGVELTGKTLGIIGCGNIGAIVADRAQGLTMRVVAYDPFLSPERAVELGVERVSLDELLARADFITLHTPLTDATRNIIDAAAHRQDEARRAHHQLRARRPRRREPTSPPRSTAARSPAPRSMSSSTSRRRQNPLFGRDNLVATPHLGAATTEAQENVALQIAEQMADFLLTGAVQQRGQHAVA